MAVMTEFEIKKFLGQPKITLPAGTIVTPAAKDWAAEHKTEIIYENMLDGTKNPAANQVEIDKKVLLKRIIELIVAEKRKNGLPVQKEELTELVIACLKRIGCQI